MNLTPQKLSCVLLWSALASAGAATLQYDIQAYIDGRDLLCISSNALQWHHLDFAAVGRWGGGNAPTIISCWSNSVLMMSNVNWYPTWPSPPPAEIRYDAWSAAFTELTPALPSHDMDLNVQVVQARSVFAVNQLPSSTNSYTLILDFNDDAVGTAAIGYAAWYHVLVTATPRAPRFTAITQSPNAVQLKWEAVAGQTYQLQSTTNLANANWVPLQFVTATNTLASVIDPDPLERQRFYRLLVE